MPINEEEKQYIIEEETLRFETKKKLMQEELGRWGPWGHPAYAGMGYGCHGRRHFMGFGLLKVLVLGLAVFGLIHLFHGRACGWGPAYNGGPAPQAAPAVPPAKD